MNPSPAANSAMPNAAAVRSAAETHSNAVAIPVWIAAVLLIFGAAVVNQSAAHWRADVADDHLFAYYGWRVAHGDRPYLDLWDNKPPGIFWVNALAMSLDPRGVGGVIGICGIALVVCMTAFVVAARDLFGKQIVLPAALCGAALLTDLRYECGGDRTETFVSALEMLVCCGYLRWLATRRTGWLVLAAFSAGAAPLFKQAGIAAAAACAAHFAWLLAMWRFRLKSRDIAAAIVCATAPPAIAAALLSSPGQWGEAWHAVVTFNHAYFAIGDATFTNLGPALGVYLPALAGLAAPAGLAAIGVLIAIAVRVHRGKEEPADALPSSESAGGDAGYIAGAIAIPLLWLLVSFYLALISPGRREYHLMPLLPPLGLLAVWPLAQLVGRRDVLRRLIARPSLIGVLLIWGGVAIAPAADSLTYEQQAWRAKPNWCALTQSMPTDDQLRAARIRELTRDDDSIYVFGWSPGTYRYALRPCASRFATTEKVGQVGEHAAFILDGIAADLRRNPPALFFISPPDWSGLPKGRLADLAAWLAENYVESDEIGGMRLFLRKYRSE